VRQEHLAKPLRRIVEALNHFETAAAFLRKLAHGVREDKRRIGKAREAVPIQHERRRRNDALDQAGDVLIPHRPAAAHHVERKHYGVALV
jgi:hypothetical protein